MTLDNNTRPGRWRIQNLSRPPMLFESGEPVRPDTGFEAGTGAMLALLVRYARSRALRRP